MEHGEGTPDLSINVNKYENFIVFVLAILTDEYYGIIEKGREDHVRNLHNSQRKLG